MCCHYQTAVVWQRVPQNFGWMMPPPQVAPLTVEAGGGALREPGRSVLPQGRTVTAAQWLGTERTLVGAFGQSASLPRRSTLPYLSGRSPSQ